MGSNYAGVDWASEKHDVLIADQTGEELFGRECRARRGGAAVAVQNARAPQGDAGG